MGKKKPSSNKKSGSIASKQAPKTLVLEKAVGIERIIPEGQKAVYANHFVIQSEQSVFHLFCFQVNTPMLIGSPEEIQKMASSLESVKGECVAHVIIPAHQMEAVISAMQENMSKHLARASGEIDIGSLIANGVKKNK